MNTKNPRVRAAFALIGITSFALWLAVRLAYGPEAALFAPLGGVIIGFVGMNLAFNWIMAGDVPPASAIDEDQESESVEFTEGSRYVKEPKSIHAGWDSPDIEHLDGVPWFEAPLPPVRHRCFVQTSGWVGFTQYQRCACGAIRSNLDARAPWLEKNSSRKSERRPVPDTPYIERKQAEIDEHEALMARFRP